MIVGLMNVYNEEEYIKYSAGCLYPFVDKLVVIDGCDYRFPGANKHPHSTDKTAQLLKELDTDGKLVYIKKDKPYPHFKDQRAELLQHVSPGDKCIMLDGDEVLKPKDIKLLLKCLDKYEYIGLRHHHFFSDFYTKQQGYAWDGWVHRAWKHREDFSADVHHGFFALKENGKNILALENEGKVKVYASPDIWVYHYGYVRSLERIKAKFEYYYKRRYKFTKNVIPWQKMLEVENVFRESWWNGSNYQGIHNRCQLERFKGKHPTIMNDHPMFGIHRLRRLPTRVHLEFPMNKWTQYRNRYGNGVVESIRCWDVNFDLNFIEWAHNKLRHGGKLILMLTQDQLKDEAYEQLTTMLVDSHFDSAQYDAHKQELHVFNRLDRYGWDYDKTKKGNKNECS